MENFARIIRINIMRGFWSIQVALVNFFSILLVFFISFQTGFSQGENYEFERIKIGDNKNIVVGMDLSPDQQQLAISSVQSFPLYLFDWSKRELNGKFEVGEWYAGSSVKYSSGGKYILLQQLFYIDWAPNKDREVNFEVIASENGSKVLNFDKIHAAVFTPDEKYIVTLTTGEVAFWNLISGNKDRSFTVAGASNAVGISPDGKHIAVSHHPDVADLKNKPALAKNKKALKIALKYKQQISIFNTETFARESTVDELYDIVYRLEYAPDGKTLFCLNIPHVKAQTAVERITYINTIDVESGKALRKGFVSRATYEPDFELSRDGKLFGLVSQSLRFPELHIYDFGTGTLLKRFELASRLLEKHKDDLIVGDMRTSFVFLPDNRSILLTSGNHLILWEMNLND